jgi:hypothetical protein
MNWHMWLAVALLIPIAYACWWMMFWEPPKRRKK